MLGSLAPSAAADPDEGGSGEVPPVGGQDQAQRPLARHLQANMALQHLILTAQLSLSNKKPSTGPAPPHTPRDVCWEELLLGEEV